MFQELPQKFNKNPNRKTGKILNYAFDCIILGAIIYFISGDNPVYSKNFYGAGLLVTTSIFIFVKTVTGFIDLHNDSVKKPFKFNCQKQNLFKMLLFALFPLLWYIISILLIIILNMGLFMIYGDSSSGTVNMDFYVRISSVFNGLCMAILFLKVILFYIDNRDIIHDLK